ncbi:MAG: 3-deoxy-manno-octulosonate cytidylyltransferase [Chitinispirillales bacterium]|jgi:3-deoxy-manno-octulosonate cytidylyltransferase (CMP-KDO synthetase)|nr:3-deoxy-manno-octulosonate cytidylyltransferase [Chitinispirillales bacterium]
MQKKVLCVIPARYGSTRLPAKPLLEIRGLPLVMWAYNRAVESGVFSNVCVATDDQRIIDAVERFGGVSLMTSKDHERGSDRVCETASRFDCSYVVNLQGDEPDVPVNIIKDFVSSLDIINDNSLLTVVSRCNFEEAQNPHVVKAVLDNNGRALYFSRSLIPFDRDNGDGKYYYKHLGIYGFTKGGLSKFCSFAQGILEKRESLEQLRALERGMTIHTLIRDFISVGIDTPEDFERFASMNK